MGKLKPREIRSKPGLSKDVIRVAHGIHKSLLGLIMAGAKLPSHEIMCESQLTPAARTT